MERRGEMLIVVPAEGAALSRAAVEDCWDDVCLGGTLQICSSKIWGFADELALQGILH